MDRRWLPRASLAAALTLGALAAVTAAGAAQTFPRPDFYSGQAVAVAAHYGFDQKPGFAVINPFYGDVPQGDSTFDSNGTISAHASSLYPGSGTEGLLTLICSADARIPCDEQFPPPYPLSATAEHPSRPDSDAPASGGTLGGDGAPLGLRPGAVHAHADANYVDTVAHAHGLDVFGTVTAQSLSATTHQQFDKSVLVTQAQSTVRGLNIGGVVKVDSITARSVAYVDGDKVRRDDTTVSVQGTTVAGQPATIDDKGIHLGPGGDDGAAGAAANAALKGLEAAGISVRLLGVTRDNAPDGALRAHAQGLLVSFTHKVAGVPPPPECLPIPDTPLPIPNCPPSPNRTYLVSVTLGGAGTAAFAGDDPFDDGSDGEVIDPGPSTPPTTTDPGSSGDGGTVTLPGTTTTINNPGTSGADTGGSPAVAPGSGSTRTIRRVDLRSLFILTSLDGMEAAYLVGSLLMLGLFLLSRFAVPARLPRA